MRYAMFQTELAKLARWFHKTLTDDYPQILYERISHIPDEAFQEIVTDILETERYWPVPRRFLQGWAEWQERNPSRMMRQPLTDCPACGGYGIIDVWRYDQNAGTWYGYGMRCGECEAGDKALPPEVPKITQAKVRQIGWRLRPEW